MPQWRDDLRPAAFRGVTFQVEEHTLSGGRRGPLHEYPERDAPYRQDLGRKARRYQVRGFVLGTDYMPARDRLLHALETKGPGVLVHPYYGTLRVAVEAQGFTIAESKREGGMARFDMTFVDAGRNHLPTGAITRGDATRTAADAALSAAKTAFVAKFNAGSKPGFVRDEAESLVDKFTAAVRAIAGGASGAAAFKKKADAIENGLPGSLTDPDGLGGDMAALVGLSPGTAATVRDAILGLLKLAGFGDDLDPVPTGTATRQVQADNQGAIVAYIRRLAVIEAGRASADAAYTSLDDATGARGALADAIDGAVSSAGASAEDGAFAALGDLRTAVIRDISARSADLSSLIDVTMPATLPAQVVAYRLYGDASRADEIVRINGIAHPGFIPGGQVLKVLDA